MPRSRKEVVSWERCRSAEEDERNSMSLVSASESSNQTVPVLEGSSAWLESSDS